MTTDVASQTSDRLRGLTPRIEDRGMVSIDDDLKRRGERLNQPRLELRA